MKSGQCFYGVGAYLSKELQAEIEEDDPLRYPCTLVRVRGDRAEESSKKDIDPRLILCYTTAHASRYPFCHLPTPAPARRPQGHGAAPRRDGAGAGGGREGRGHERGRHRDDARRRPDGPGARRLPGPAGAARGRAAQAHGADLLPGRAGGGRGARAAGLLLVLPRDAARPQSVAGAGAVGRGHAEAGTAGRARRAGRRRRRSTPRPTIRSRQATRTAPGCACWPSCACA